jgi:hypothetical protein
MSFDYEKFQIDLIKCNSNEDLESSRFYFSYGDLGAIMGRIVNYYGLKFGNEGLWINLIENTLDKEKSIDMTKIFGKILLTKNSKEICNFLELDFNKWNDGFSNRKQICDWIISSKYFKKEIFYDLNYDHRKRLSIRQFYKEFLEYIDININIITKVNNLESEIKINLQNIAINFFKKEDELNKIVENNKLLEIRRNKFNGKILIDLGINEKELGKIILNFKNFIKNEFSKTFEEYVDEIHMYVLNNKEGNEEWINLKMANWLPRNYTNEYVWSYAHLQKREEIDPINIIKNLFE